MDEGRGIGLIGEGEGGELEAGDPALGPLIEDIEGGGGESEASSFVDKSVGFGGGEAELVGADFGELVASAEAAEGERGVLAGGDDEMRRGGKVFEEEGELVIDSGVIDEMIIIEDEDDGLGEGGEGVDEGGEDGFDGWGLRGLEEGGYVLAEGREDGLERGDEIAPKAVGVVIIIIEGEPSGGA